jgi:thiol-disulfide isomerase/thioredoxin
MTKRKRGPHTPTPPPSDRRLPVLLLVLGGLALVVVVGIVIAVSGGNGDGSGNGGSGDGGTAVDRGAAVFGNVTVDGTALPQFVATADDPAAGLVAPTIGGETPDGDAVTAGGAGEPTLVVFLAHWCPHCQVELPRLVDLAEQGAFEGIRTVAVLTGSNSDAPNFPPVPWVDREGWTGDVLLDDESSTAARAYGLDSYPYIVMLDGAGAVVGRAAGELADSEVVALVEAAAAT